MHAVRYFIEAILLYAFYGIFKILPVEMASNFGGWLGRVIGPRMGATRKAEKHIRIAFPDISDENLNNIVTGMWDNLGRVFAEYPHIRHIAQTRTVIKSAVDLEHYIGSDKGAVFAGAHFGNWEIGCAAPFLQMGLEVDSAYRAPNNPWAESLLLNARTLGKSLKSYSKSRSGGVALLKAAKEKRNIVILFDQKYNEGVSVPFFGKDATTNPVFVQLGKKYGLDVLPVHIVRVGPARFELHVDAPMDLEQDDIAIMQNAHAMLEAWITKNPEQWIWLHRRWKED